MNYFGKLLELLKIEKEEDRRAYRELSGNSSVSDRRANGICWYPVAIRGTELVRGDYISVELERTTHQDIQHQFRFGSPAVLFSNHDPKTDRLEGSVTFQGGNHLKITLLTEELPDWASDGKLGIDLLFDENSYEEMEQALKQAALNLEKPAGHLLQVLTGIVDPSFRSDLKPLVQSSLNTSQQEALQLARTARDLAIIHGPPGTGKTTTVVQAIKSLLADGAKRILVVAPSNTAVDLLTEKIAAEGVNVLRIGNPARVSERLMSLTFDSKMSEHSRYKEIKKYKKQAAEYKNMAHKYKRSFGRAEREQRKALFDEAHKIMKEAGSIEQYIQDDLIAQARIITATLVGSNHFTVRSLTYDALVIDEAGQALEPACWIPILKAQKLVLAGDHLQLPPTIKSEEAARKGLAETLLEKCTHMYPQALILLEEQYRMHESIMNFSSGKFYQNRLKAHVSVGRRLLFEADLPLSFIDTAGCGFDEKPEGSSYTNPEEAAFLFRHLLFFLNELNVNIPGTEFPSIAIISPYKQQVLLLQQQFSEISELKEHAASISVNTIDSFQGQERDIVYISMTRSNSKGEIGFLSDIRRMNVAMTRAKKKLVVIGDSATLSGFDFYADFISYAEKLESWKSAWEYM